MADFLWAVLKLAVFQGLLVELLKVGMQKSAWRALSALKSFLLLVGIWLALQVFIAALLIWPIHARSEERRVGKEC